MSKINLTPLDLEKKTFSVSFRGFNPQEVTAYLEKVSAELEALIKENRTLQELLQQKESEIKRLQESEDLLKNTLMLAKQTADETILNAKQKAEVIINEAHQTRKEILRGLEKIKAERSALIVQIKSFMDAYYEKLSVLENDNAVIEIRSNNG